MYKLLSRYKVFFVFLYLLSFNAISADSIKYNFSVLFTAKTCDIITPGEIIFSSSGNSGVVTANDIKNNKITKNFNISLNKCNTSELKGSSVFISQGNTLTGTDDFFNNDNNSNIGVRIADGTKIFSRNSSDGFTPNANSIVWGSINNQNEIKQLTAKLECKKEGCNAKEGDFSASLTLSFFSN